MLTKLVHLLCRVGLVASVIATSGAYAACVDTSDGIPLTRLNALRRGFNLAGQLDTANAALMHQDILRTLRDRGMRHVRLPVPAERIMARFSGETVVANQLRDVERIAKELIALGFYVSIDLHPGDAFQKLHRSNAEQAMTSLKAAWASLATIIRRLPSEKVFAELLNEPDVDAQRWQSEVTELAAFVRARLPETTLIVGPVNWQRADSLANFQPLEDRNVVYAIHFYDPMAFTHQGHWNPADPLSNIKGLPFPVRRDDSVVRNLRAKLITEGKEQSLKELDAAIESSSVGDIVAEQLEPARQWQHDHRRPLLLNEFGVFKQHAPRASRINWIRSVARFAETNCWGWAYWELAQGFGLLNERRSLDDDVVRALLNP